MRFLDRKYNALSLHIAQLAEDANTELRSAIERQQQKIEAKKQFLKQAFTSDIERPFDDILKANDLAADKDKLKEYFAAEAKMLKAKAQELEDFAKKPKTAAEKAQTDAKAKAAAALAAQGWTYKQIIGFNAITYVAATVAQNMLEGWVGVDVTGTDKRTPKQKALDALKAIVALDKHKAHFVELYRT